MPQKLAQHLVSRGLLPAKSLDEALRRLQAGGAGIDTVLLEQGVISEAGMLQAVADVSKLRLVNLADFEPNREAATHLPAKISRRLNVVPLSLDKTSLHLACAYPVPQKELREVAFLLGKHLELWVALEVRVRDWQAALYGDSLSPRFLKLLGRMDPQRQPVSAARVEPDGIDVDLTSGETKVPDPFAQVGGERPSAPDVLNATTVLDPLAYSAYAKPVLGIADVEHTTVLDPSGYASFAKAVSESGSAPRPRKDRTPTEPEMPAVSAAAFPGGVLPPRASSGNPQGPTHRVVRAVDRSWVTPASAPRPAGPKLSASAPRLRSASAEAPPVTARPVVTPAPLAPPRLKPDDETLPPHAPDRPRSSAPEPPLALTAAAAQAERARHGGPPPPPPPTPLATEDELRASAAGDDELPTQAEAQLPVAVASAPLPAHPMASRPGDETLDQRPPSAGEDTLDERLQMPAAVAEQTYDERLPAAPALTPEGQRPTGEAGAVPREARAEALSPALPLPEAAAAALGPADWSLAQARDALKLAAQDRDQLLAVALEYGRRAFEFTAAFAVVRGAAWAWDARGPDGPVNLSGVAVPLDAASIFRTVALTRGSYVGPLPPDSHTQHYLALFGRAPRACFVWPVEVKGRLVALLYGDTGTRPMSQRRLADFILFCQDLPAAFHELIAFRKLRTGAGAPFAEAGGEVPLPAALPGAAVADDQAPPDAALIEGLISLLTGPDARERAEATAELQRAPAAAAQALAARFPGPTGWSRLPVVELPEADELGPIAGAMSRLGREGARALAPLLDSDDSDVRYFALLTAGALPFAELLPGVLRGLFDFEPDVSSAARAAASALKHVDGFATHLKQLHQELSSRDSLRRSLAARALGMLHDRDAIEGLINLTGSDDQLSAQAAAEALRDICKVNLGTKPRAWLSWFAQARAQRRTEWLLDALAADDFELRLGAIEELSRSLGDNLGYFADGAPEERSAAVERWRSAIAARPSLDL